MSFEHRSRPLLPRWRFILRLLRSVGVAAALVGPSLGIGAVGYHHYEGLDWLDATMNAAMLLSGMGPVHNPATRGGKIFATCYALFSGMLFLTVAAVLFAPLLHRLVHKFHLQLEEDDKGSTGP